MRARSDPAPTRLRVDLRRRVEQRPPPSPRSHGVARSAGCENFAFVDADEERADERLVVRVVRHLEEEAASCAIASMRSAPGEDRMIRKMVAGPRPSA